MSTASASDSGAYSAPPEGERVDRAVVAAALQAAFWARDSTLIGLSISPGDVLARLLPDPIALAEAVDMAMRLLGVEVLSRDLASMETVAELTAELACHATRDPTLDP